LRAPTVIDGDLSRYPLSLKQLARRHASLPTDRLLGQPAGLTIYYLTLWDRGRGDRSDCLARVTQ
jgi:hypothetical protein